MSVTIIIFHYESLAYLRAVVRQIHKYRRDDIEQHIIIVDQSPDPVVRKTLVDEFEIAEGLSVIFTPPYGSGYSVDYILRNFEVSTTYLCTIDVDTIPIHKNWLYVPIQILEMTDYAWVGVHAEIEAAYSHMGDFFCMCQHFRVAKTETYKDLAVNAGFCKKDHRKAMQYVNNDWKGWSDDAVIAHWWEDQYRQNNKLTLAVTKYMGIAPLEGRYGRYTDDLVMHVGFSYNYKKVRDRHTAMGEEFLDLMRRMDSGGLSDALLDEMLSTLRPLESPIRRVVWDAKTRTSRLTNNEENLLIDKLKTE